MGAVEALAQLAKPEAEVEGVSHCLGAIKDHCKAGGQVWKAKASWQGIIDQSKRRKV